MAAFGPAGPGTAALTQAGKNIAFNQRFNARFNQRFNQKYGNIRRLGPGTGIASGSDGATTTFRGGAPGPPAPARPPGPAGNGLGYFTPGTPGYNAAKALHGGSDSTSGGASASSTQGNGLDSTYFANVNANQFKVGNQINALNLKGAEDQTALQSALAQLAYAQPRAQLALEQKANNAGSLYSSVYDQNLGNLNYNYLGKQGALQQRYGDQLAGIDSQINALQLGEPIYDAQQAAAAVARSSNLAAKNPALGAYGPSSPVSPATQALARAAFNRRFNREFNEKFLAKRGRR